MSFQDWAFHAGHHRCPDEIVQRIAEQNLDEIRQRLTGLTPDMSAAEARGYTRARAAAVVQREVQAEMLRDPGLRFADRDRLVQRTVELVADRLGAERRQRSVTAAA